MARRLLPRLGLLALSGLPLVIGLSLWWRGEQPAPAAPRTAPALAPTPPAAASSATVVPVAPPAEPATPVASPVEPPPTVAVASPVTEPPPALAAAPPLTVAGSSPAPVGGKPVALVDIAWTAQREPDSPLVALALTVIPRRSGGTIQVGLQSKVQLPISGSGATEIVAPMADTAYVSAWTIDTSSSGVAHPQVLAVVTLIGTDSRSRAVSITLPPLRADVPPAVEADPTGTGGTGVRVLTGSDGETIQIQPGVEQPLR